MDEVRELEPGPAVRLIFEYEGDEVRLVAQEPVDMAVPGFDLAPVPQAGHYVETRTADDEPLSRVPVREAFLTSAEVFPEEPGGAITRVDIAEPKGAFTVVVPATEAATQIALLRVEARAEPREPGPPTAPTSPAGDEAAVVELGRFSLEGAPRAEGENR